MIIAFIYWLLVLGCAGESITEGVQGDFWRCFGLGLAFVLLILFRHELDQAL